jgi:hypothetical protein
LLVESGKDASDTAADRRQYIVNYRDEQAVAPDGAGHSDFSELKVQQARPAGELIRSMAEGEPMTWTGSYEALRQYLHDFTNIGGDPAYDTNGILMLLLALADNLRESGPALADLRELAETVSPEQARFLEQQQFPVSAG